MAQQKSSLGLGLVQFQPFVVSAVGPAGCRTHAHTHNVLTRSRVLLHNQRSNSALLLHANICIHATVITPKTMAPYYNTKKVSVVSAAQIHHGLCSYHINMHLFNICKLTRQNKINSRKVFFFFFL